MPVMVGKNGTPVFTTSFAQADGMIPKLQLVGLFHSEVKPSQVLVISFELNLMVID
jgi:hypothetical protein